jgi:hypothetical protein
MVLNLTKDDFENNFFSVKTESGCVLKLYALDENFVYDKQQVSVRSILINFCKTVDGTEYVKECISAIGLSGEYISITSDYEEYLGQVLTLDNIQYCNIIVPEDSDITVE